MHKEIKDWLENGVIDQATASRIEAYLATKHKSPQSYFLVFGLIGSVLTGLGLMLIIAHNWEFFSIFTKTCLSLAPLILAQAFSAYVIWKKYNNDTWRESAATLLFFSVGAAMAMISQTYHIEGDEKSFILTWMLLVLPVLYIMNSSMSSLIFLAGITFYGALKGYGDATIFSNEYWLLLLSVLPFYIHKIHLLPHSLFTSVHHWLIPLSILIVFGSLHGEGESWVLAAYLSLLGLFVLIGSLSSMNFSSFFSNGYKISGYLGTFILLFVVSFKDWHNHIYPSLNYFEFFPLKIDFWITILISFVFIIIWFMQRKKVVFTPVFLVAFLIILLFLIPLPSVIPQLLINLMLLLFAVYYISKGLHEPHIGVLNSGLGIFSMLVFCRFFDTDISFVWRGIVFLLVGAAFFASNFYMYKKRKKHDI